MKILMLSWEYPPKNVGGLSTHVYNLSQALKNQGHEVHIITCEEGTAPVFEEDNGVVVHRVAPFNIPTDDFTKWVMHLNFAMIEEGIRIIREVGRFDVIHAHDWLVANCAKVLKWAYKIPVISTIHATEMGRNGGIRTEIQRYISSTEWLLSYEAWKVIVCSNYMKNQVEELFKTPEDKVCIISNGVDSNEFDIEFDKKEFKENYVKEYENIVFFVGRHVYEKGVHLLIEAAHRILEEEPNTKFIIAGQGPMTAELKDKVYQQNLNDKFIFVGYIDSLTKNKLYKVAEVAVFPSIYEPFGIVALEAMAAGCPVVVSDTGGLGEIIDHEVNGLKMINGLANSLSDNVVRILKDKEMSLKLRDEAYNTIHNQFSWKKVAQITEEVYRIVKEESKGTDWEGLESAQTEDVKKKRTYKKKAFKKGEANIEASNEETISLAEESKIAIYNEQEVAAEKAKREVKASVRKKTVKPKQEEAVTRTRSKKAEEVKEEVPVVSEELVVSMEVKEETPKRRVRRKKTETV